MNEQTIEMQPEAYVAGQGGAVNSVNGQTGDVVLTTSDLENTSDYQTGSEVEATVAEAVAGKQDTLTAGSNIQINGDTISATDTTYTAGSGLDLTGTEFSVDTNTIATKQSVDDEITARQNADNSLQGQIDAISASSDVTDIVGTKAALNAYDTSTLKDNDIIKVLQDESQNDETTYYRWSTSTETFTLIGEEGPYYTKSAVDTLLNAKQNTLTAGSNITISSDTISATDTTYSNFTGTDGTAAGVAGLVPAPATKDAGKYLKADGTWEAVSAGPTVVQTTGTSQTDVMSQNATTGMIYTNPGTNDRIRIGQGSSVTGNYGIAIGGTSTVAVARGVAIGYNATAIGAGYDSVVIGRGTSATANSSVAIGSWSIAATAGVVSVGNTARTDLYNGTGYRLITNVYDGQSAHDAATYGQVISYSAINGAGAPTTATEGKYVGQLYYDTTNEAMYFLKEIDTTATPATYTWEALGGGGSSVNVVQTTGTSTTDVMSQNATTNLIYPNNHATSVVIGKNAQQSFDNRSSNTIIGYRAQSRVYSDNVVTIGAQSASTGSYSTSVGSSSDAQEFMATALGSYSYASGKYSVGLGAYSNATSKGQVDISTLKSTNTYGYNDSQYRLLTGLYDGQSAHDAANVGQLNSRVIGSLTAAPTTSTAGAVGALVATVESGTGHLYICTDDTGGSYTWQLLV